MAKYLTYIQYDGSIFNGFQIQKDEKSVAYFINKALRSIPTYKNVLQYAGRTDSKVHSLGNAISFELEKYFHPDTINKILNSILPKEIRAVKTCLVKEDFNPRFDAIKRIYLYIIYIDNFLPPFLSNKVYFINRERLYNNTNLLDIDITKFKNILKLFEGYYNFEAYTTSSEKRNKWRYIYSIIIKKINSPTISKSGFFYFIQISGKSFLHKQIRGLIGCSLYAYNLLIQNQNNENEIFIKIKESLINGKKPFNFSFAPPEGLYFKKVIFKNDIYINK
ncbi:MAG: hypothetical protein N3A58_08490 [Spirochaetes bacterium]|nr:hypothetical protein [Spirochaetota bacterium]